MTIINPSNLPLVTLPPHGEPCEGRRALLCPLNFANDSTLTLDLTGLMQQQVISQLMVIFIDLSGSPNGLAVAFNNSQQVIAAKAGSQGYYRVLTPNPTKITFMGSAGQPQLINVFLINFSIDGQRWDSV